MDNKQNLMDKMNCDIAIIFDFNGTCIFDRTLHNKAWQTYIEELTLTEVSDEDVSLRIQDKTGKEILESFLGYELNDNMVFQLSEEKERIYRALLIREDLQLAPGLEDFLNFILLARVKRCIATTANLENMNLYFERYNLERWFKWEEVIIGAGNIPLKPHPDLYLAAVSKLDMPTDRILVFENSTAGVKAAAAAGINHIIGITGDSHNRSLMNHPGVMAVVNNYTELSSIEI
ncbi:MAG: HAD family phosphatase [Eubacterium sp.]|nr:HAD family phosphatase [Eubacterium sp.]